MLLVDSPRERARLRVEQPALARLSGSLQVDAMRAVPSLVAALDTLERIGSTRTGARARSICSTPYFADRGCRRSAPERPTLAQVAVTLGTRANRRWAARRMKKHSPRATR